jgi:hypothetical protein
MKFAILTLLLLSACASRSGRVAIGQTPAEVEVALGKPDKRYNRASEKENLDIWAWSAYSGAFDVSSDASIGQTPRDVPGGGIKDDEELRVVFRDGKVVFFESRQR